MWKYIVALWREDGDEDNPALDYAFLQKVIGLIALLLPIIVVAFKGLLQHDWSLEGSISHFYYTRGRNYFVSSLSALAVFFLAYHHGATGRFRIDNMLSNFASVMALVVAFFPTTKDKSATRAEKVVGAIHLTCAGLLFLALGIFALFLFRRSAGPKTAEKDQRNILYTVCGATIFACLAALAVTEFVDVPRGWPALYWFETVMVEAFAVAWLVKGQFLGILVDHQSDLPIPVANGPQQ